MRGNTVLAQPSDSGMVRVDEETNLGVAVSTDCNGRFAQLDPYAGAQLALAESYRNVATGGATPLAISDCLNFGSPEDPAVMWQFAEACRGLKDACLELGIPVTGGNVSLYNQTGETAILPTPVVAVLGVIEDVTRRTPTAWAAAGERVFLLGETREELSGSEWAHVVHGHLGGLPPRVDLAARAGPRRAARATGVGLLTCAHDLVRRRARARRWSSAALRHDVGVSVALRRRPVRRAVQRVGRPGAGHRRRRRRRARWSSSPREHGVPLTPLGVTGGDALVVDGQFEVPLAELREAWTATLPAALADRRRATSRTTAHRAEPPACTAVPALAARGRRVRGVAVVRMSRWPDDRYGDHPAQYAELTRPAGQPRGVAVLVHGGFWKPRYGIEYARPLVPSLVARGWATWAIEYRRGTGGAPTPSTTSRPRSTRCPLAAGTVVGIGHSAGGHLPPGRPSARRPDPRGLARPGCSTCGRRTTRASAAARSRRFLGHPPGPADAGVDPIRMVPLDVPVWCVHGRARRRRPDRQSRAYVEAARAAGARAELRRGRRRPLRGRRPRLRRLGADQLAHRGDALA